MHRTLTYCGAAVLAGCLAFGSPLAALAAGKGKGKDRVLSKVMFIHYRRGHARPPWAGGGGGGGNDQEGSFTLLSKGAKWKSVEDVRLNLTAEENVNGSLDGVIADAVLAGLNEWETAGGASHAIFGDVIPDSTVTYDGGAFRGYNTISFGLYSDPGVIGVTSVWGYFNGPPSQREIVETHMLLNDSFEWGDASADGDGDGDPDSHLMDLQNILTHELGHCVGLGDLYDPAAGDETMYGYSAEGELKKRDLYLGDIAGTAGFYG